MFVARKPSKTDNSDQFNENKCTDDDVAPATLIGSDTDCDSIDVEAAQRPQCAICLETFKDGDEISSSHNNDCNHGFHRECIFEWLLKHDDCPFCRRMYLRKSRSIDTTTGDIGNLDEMTV